MTYAMKIDDVWIALPYGRDIVNTEGTQASYSTVMCWSEKERNAFGVFTVLEVDTAPPTGKIETSRVLNPDGAIPSWEITYGDAPPPSPPMVPQNISDRQFFQQLAIAGTITQADALAAVKTGTIPPQLEAIIQALPTEQQFSAEMLLSGATSFERNHPLTNVIGAAVNMNPDQVDQFFIAADKL